MAKQTYTLTIERGTHEDGTPVTTTGLVSAQTGKTAMHSIVRDLDAIAIVETGLIDHLYKCVSIQEGTVFPE